MQLLFDLAEMQGIRVEYARLRGRDGEYRDDLRLIRLREGMSLRRMRSILAHELGHAAFGDVPTPYGPLHARQERRADEWAALRLISFEAYREAESVREGHVASMAHDLGVISRIVEAYQRVLEREFMKLAAA
jgi:Zn-dependent peptidase ImmA (M78 family)